MLDLTLAISLLAAFINCAIVFALRRYLRRIDRRIKEYIDPALRHMHSIEQCTDAILRHMHSIEQCTDAALRHMHSVEQSISAVLNRSDTVLGHIRSIDTTLPRMQLNFGKLAFQGNPAVQSLIEALRLEAPYTDHEPCYSISRLLKNLNISWPVESSSDIVICTVALGEEYRDSVDPCLDSHKTYAKRHGYRYAVLEHGPPHQDRSHSWMKLPLILRLLQDGAKRVFYVDADAMITNIEIPLETYFTMFEDRADIFLTEDEAGINCGVMFVANTAGARRIFDLIWLYDADIDNPTWEQNAFKILMNDLSEVRRRVLIEAQPKSFNSVPVERRLFYDMQDKNIWTNGDFICHFSGIRASELRRLVREYAKAQQVTKDATKG